MKSLWQDDSKAEILRRIAEVDGGTKGKWGSFTADRMLSHLVESLKMAVGELDVKSKKLPIRYFPLKQLILYVLPFPKGTPTAPELLAGKAEPVDELKSELRRLIAKFSEMAGRAEWHEHPAFGTMTKNAWGVLVYRHMDHHLRQFGV
ncbi:MAG TPA: DUF1569 domain-containing protein [Thermoanaerobaculia bacterium]|nr:DUF1569 domain-containing protein [Thermoanaerobaculia bacterium]